MRETWDIYWDKAEALSVETVIENDSYYRLLKRLVDLREYQNMSILEVGCGSGIRTLALLKEFQNYLLNATLVDFSPSALAFAKKNADEAGIVLNFILANALKLPFPDASFDIVWNEGVNEHFDGEERQLVFNEMARVCKRGGQVIIIVPNALNLPYRLWKKVLEKQGRWEYGFEKPFTFFELKNRMREAEIIPVKIGGAGVLSPFFHLLQIIPKKNTSKTETSVKQSAVSGVLNKIFHRAERLLERVTWFAGGNIGVKGIRCD